MIKILKSGGHMTVQDLGRRGYQQFGVSVCGAMDVFAFKMANALLGNDDHCAALEASFTGPELLFLRDTKVAITGAKAPIYLNNLMIEPWQSHWVRQGDILRIGSFETGSRLYIACKGGIDVPLVMGSRSTDLKAEIGGLEGRALRANDVLALPPVSDGFDGHDYGIGSSLEAVYGHPNLIRVIMGPQQDAFTDEGLYAFLNTPYHVSMDSNRMGYRLLGKPILMSTSADILSEGLAFGSIQVPSNGQPIVMLADRQPTGGYAKIAVIIHHDLPKFSQLRPGDYVSFQAVTQEEVEALKPLDAYIKKTPLKRYQITLSGVSYRVSITWVD